MSIFLLRHGETDLNREGRMQGQCDTHLNSLGRQQAEMAAKVIRQNDLHFDRVFVSPLARAVETCEIAAGLKREEMILDRRIMEMRYGIYDGVLIRDFLEELIDFFQDPEGVPVPDPSMEAGLALRSRAASFLEDLRQHSEENVLVVSHEIIMHSLLSVLLGKSFQELDTYWLGNGEIFKIDGILPGEEVRIETLK